MALFQKVSDLASAQARIAELEAQLTRHAQTLEELHLHQEELRVQNEELRQAQTELDSARRSYQDLFEYDPVAHFLLDGGGRIVRFNHAARTLLGWAGRQLGGFVFLDLSASGPDRSAIAGFVRDHLQGRAVPPLQCTLVARDGKMLPVELHGYQSPALAGVSVTAVDIGYRAAIEAERRRIEAEQRINLERLVAERTDELAAAEAKFRSLVEQTLVGICIVQDDLIRYANPAFGEMFRFPLPGAIADTPYAPLLQPDERERVAADQARLATGEVAELRYELAALGRDGSPLHVEAFGRPIRHDGRPATIWAVLDVTARRRSETERQELEAQLRQAHKMEALGTLTGGIAHDFNNILAAILGYAGLARHYAEAGGRLDHCLAQVIQSGERGRDLVTKMLAYARSQDGGAAEPIDPLPVARDTVKMLAATIPAGIELAIDCDGDLPAVRISTVDLQQLLMNLIINARDAIGERGRITVALGRVEVADAECASCRQRFRGAFLEMAVHDTGHGMEPAVLARLFDPFFTTKEVGKGSGLGLSVAQGILRQAGGHALIESTPGQGTRFRLLFPVAGRPGAAVPTAVATAPVAEAESRADGRIWVVDDEALLAEYWAALLTTMGYEVKSFTSPEALLAAFRQAPDAPDLLLTDHTMPRMSGHELARAVLAIRPTLPVFMCSGDVGAIDRGEAPAVRQYFQKPVASEELLAAIAREMPVGKA